MNTTSENTSKQEGAIYFFSILLRYKVFIIITVIIITAASVIISLIMPKWYAATANVVHPQHSGSAFEGAIGNITSKLKDFGLGKLGGSGGGSTYDFIVVLESRSLKDSLINRFDLMTVYEIEDSLMYKVRKELDGNMEISLEKEGNYLITIYDKSPERAAQMTNTMIEIANDIAKDKFNYEASLNRQYLENRLIITDSILIAIGDKLGKYSSDYMIISPEDQAAAISDAMIELRANILSQEMMYEMIVNKYGEDDQMAIIQKKLVGRLKQQLKDAENKPGFAGDFSIKELSKVGIPFMQLLAEYETFTKVKAFLLPMLEEARINEVRNTKNLLVLDDAIVPEKKERPKRMVIVLGAFVGSLALSILVVFLLQGYKNLVGILKQQEL
jgi:tyrosine-protein kinase Etk/Wzc